MVFPDVAWLRQVCPATPSRARLAAIPVHAYPETWTPEGVTVENYLGAWFDTGFVRAADALCGRKPIWINETGFATVAGRTEREQANWWMRAIATFAAEPRVEEIGVYEIKDLRPDRAAIGDAPNYHLGITGVDRTKKIAFGTVTRLVALLGTAPIRVEDDAIAVGASPPDAEIYRHLFQRADGRRVLFLWTKRGPATVTVRIPGGSGAATEYGVDGAAIGRVEIDSGALVDLELRPGDVRLFEITSP
jgi:hypothetical protein